MLSFLQAASPRSTPGLGNPGIPVVVGVRVALLCLSLASAWADVVNEWNNAILDSIRSENTHPCVAARALAIVHGAMYDTGAVINREEPIFATEQVKEGLPLLQAVNAAAHSTATNLFPSRAATFRDLYKRLLQDEPISTNQPQALRLGRNIADAWITWRVNDGSSGSIPYIPGKEPGAWRRTPPFVRPPELQSWARVVPFTLVSGGQFRPPGPPALSSEAFAKDFNQVKELGGAKSTSRTAEQTEIAKFWSDFSYTVTPPGHWNQAAQAVAATRTLTLASRLKLFAILNITLSDVAIACWDAKYVYNFWRPVTAIRGGEADGNPATEADAAWMPLLNTPAFPEYVSGHSAFSAAGAIVLAHFNGSDTVEFAVPSDSLPGKVRKYQSLWECAEEVSRSRMYGGIHFTSALTDGLAMGRNIAQHALTYFLDRSSATPKVFTGVGELNRAAWVGVSTRPGKNVTLEALNTNGSWELWTNATTFAPTTRWRLQNFREASAFRARFTD